MDIITNMKNLPVPADKFTVDAQGSAFILSESKYHFVECTIEDEYVISFRAPSVQRLIPDLHDANAFLNKVLSPILAKNNKYYELELVGIPHDYTRYVPCDVDVKIIGKSTKKEERNSLLNLMGEYICTGTVVIAPDA